ncbi:MAG: DUF3168 domain-containing protein [Asticcacaulis sp.]|nr:DUF3168 domain-containing protein [Asticcacaulis sp.]
MSDLLDLQAGLLAWLRGQSSLAVWLGSPARVYDQVPAGVVYPYVSFGRVSAQSIGGVDAEVTEQAINLMCVSRFDGSEEAKAMAAELRVLLDGAALEIAGLVSLRVTYVDVFRSADQRTTYALVRLRAVTEAV